MKKILTILFLFPYIFVISQSDLTPFKENNKWGYKNYFGEVVLNPIFDYASEFKGDIAIVGDKKKDISYGVIRRDLKLIFPIVLSSVGFKGNEQDKITFYFSYDHWYTDIEINKIEDTIEKIIEKQGISAAKDIEFRMKMQMTWPTYNDPFYEYLNIFKQNNSEVFAEQGEFETKQEYNNRLSKIRKIISDLRNEYKNLQIVKKNK